MSKPKRYRKKPVVVNAMRYTGRNLYDVKAWVGPRVPNDPYDRDGFIDVDEQWPYTIDDVTALVWDRLHDTWVGVKDGQYIIQGIQGEFYPCDADVFHETYEEA